MGKIRLTDWVVILLLTAAAISATVGLVRAQTDPGAVQIAVTAQRVSDLERRATSAEARQDYIFYALLAELCANGVQLGLSVKKRERRQ